MTGIHKGALEDIEIDLSNRAPVLGFGLAELKQEGKFIRHDGLTIDGISLASIAHPVREKTVRRWVAQKFVDLAEIIGDQIWYGRDK